MEKKKSEKFSRISRFQVTSVQSKTRRNIFNVIITDKFSRHTFINFHPLSFCLYRKKKLHKVINKYSIKYIRLAKYFSKKENLSFL